jgi:adenylate cyclase
MRCSACGHANPDGATFCGECGSRLAAAACQSCGAPAAPGQKFCTACGAPLAALAAPPVEAPPPPAAPEGERKQVTVLFADVTGSMRLAEQVDPEEWRRVMDRFFTLLGQGVERFEGTVDKFTGDGIMALFGAPVAHEDHARRACYAALHLQHELTEYAAQLRREQGLNFSVRMGLNSGEVIAGGVGDGAYTAIGNTVGLASRVEQLAEPGKAYLTHATAALVRGYFELEDLGPFEIKGVSAPVHVYELASVGDARTRLDVSSARGFARFVGRDEELAALEAALDRVGQGSGEVVGIVAEPGVGKSRLCHEFIARCRERGYEVNYGTGQAHARRIPFGAALDMLRAYFGIAEDDDPRRARDKVAGRLLLLDERFKDALPVLFDFLGIPDPERPVAANMAPEARQRQLFAAMRQLAQLGGHRRHTVMVVEDLHWLDASSDAFLANIVDALPGTQTLVVVNFRPEYHAPWMQKSYYRQLPLAPLGGAAIRALLSDVLGEDPSLDGLSERIHERTGGNPFFAEEVVHGLVESGALAGAKGERRLVGTVDAVSIPPTVQAVLAARIDALPPREKQVLQAASVIGKDFDERVLRRVAGLPDEELASALSALVAAELVYAQSLYPQVEYSFKHPLTQEVAYGSQLGERRARIHAEVARALEEVHADQLDERAALLAQHLELGGDPVEASTWHLRAAAWAGRNHPAQALPHWRKVRTLIGDRPESPHATGLALAACIGTLQSGWRLGLSESDATEVFEFGSRICGENEYARTALTGSYAIAIGMAGRVERAATLARESFRLAEQLGDRELMSAMNAVYWNQVLGRFHEALAEADEKIAFTADDPTIGMQVLGFSAYAWNRMFRAGAILPYLGRLEEARRELLACIALAAELEDPETLGWAHGAVAMGDYIAGTPGDGLAHARQSVDIAERIGSSFSRQLAYFALGQALLLREEWEEAERAFEHGRRVLRETGAGVQYEPTLAASVAEARLGRGDVAGALAEAEHGAALADQHDIGFVVWFTHSVLGRVLTAAGDPARFDEAQRSLNRIVDLGSRSGAVMLEARGRFELGRLAAVRGDEEASRRELEEARRMFADAGAAGRAERAEAELAALVAS